MTNLPVMASNVLTMSSREIAALTGKRHDNVTRDIRNMLSVIYGDSPDDYRPEKFIANQQPSGLRAAVYVAQYGVTNAGIPVYEYHLDKNHTLTMLTGYDAKARFRVVQRWQELEQRLDLPKDYPTALRTLADEYERRKKVEQELAKCRAQQPAQALLPETPFLAAWWDCLGPRDVTSGDLYRIIAGHQCPVLLHTAVVLFGPPENWTGRRLGQALRGWSRRTLDGFLVLNRSKSGIIWRLERV